MWMMAGSFTKLAALVLLALSTLGCADRLHMLAAELSEHEFTGEVAGHFLQYFKTFEDWTMWARMNRPGQEAKFSEVKELSTVKQNQLREVFSSVQKDGSGVDVSSKDAHVAIAAEMLDNLKKPGAQVMDLGCGTGALLAICIEVASTNCAGCKVEGLEYENDAFESAQATLELLHEFPDPDEEKMERMGHVPWEVIKGDAFTWNQNGARDGTYHVVNVGFAVAPSTLAGMVGTRWKAALAAGGKLMVPVCKDDLQSKAHAQPEPQKAGGYRRCAAKFHVFTRGDALLEEVVEVPVRFICVGDGCDDF